MSAGVRVEAARSGRPTLVRDGKYLHSRVDPEREARRVAEPVARREPPAVLLLGLGLGYHVRELIARTEETRLLVFEPDAAIASRARELALFNDSDARVEIVGDVKTLADRLPVCAANGFETIRLPARDDEEIEQARAVADSFRGRLEINENTLRRFGRLWVRNLCRNLPRIAAARGVRELEGRAAGLPVVLLAAGPSLDQILPMLPELAKRAMVIAVDTAIAPATRCGVEPDLAVVVDPQYWNARHLDRLRPRRTILVSEASAHPFVFRSFAEPHYLCSSLFPLGRAIEQRLGRFGPLGAGGSVSTTAWDLARLMGATRVWTAGLDLGFPGGRTHTRSSFFEHLALLIADRLRTAEGVIFRYTWDASPERVAANDATTLLSDRRMEVYRTWFERQLRLPSAPPTTSITTGGAAIPGLGLSAPAELLDHPDVRASIDEALEPLRAAPDAAERGAREETVRDTATSLRDELADLERLASRALHLLASIERSENDTHPDFTPLSTVDRELAAHPGGAIGSFLMQDAISRVRGGFGSADIREQFEASYALYEGLRNAAEFHRRELGASLDRHFSGALVKFSRGEADNVSG